jgi:hypothetical protein
MVAFFTLLVGVVAAVLIWVFFLRDGGGGGDVQIVPATADFGDQDLGKRSPVLTLNVGNETGDSVRISSIAIEGEEAQDFQIVDETTCSNDRDLDDGASCTIGVRFRPRGRGDRTAAVVVRVADRQAPLRAGLRGTGVGQATVDLDATRLDLGRVLIGHSRTRRVTLTNGGNAPLAIEEILIDGKDADAFRVGRATDCPTGGTVEAGTSCTIAVTFRPKEGGGHSAELAIVHDAQGSPTGVQLHGEGRGRPQLVIDPTSLEFGPVAVGSTGDVQTVTVRNTGTALLTLAALHLAGPAPADFAIQDSSTCSEGLELDPGESCSVDLSFAPGQEGPRSAALEVETPGGVAGRVDMSGTGLGGTATTTG